MDVKSLMISFMLWFLIVIVIENGGRHVIPWVRVIREAIYVLELKM